MLTPKVTTLRLHGLLGCAAAIGLLLPGALNGPAAHAAAPPAEYDLDGIIRDFRESHSDFAIMPAEGLKHVAHNVNPWLPGDGRPLWTGGGFVVDAQWMDVAGHNIAPPIAGSTPGAGQGQTLGIRVTDKVEVKKGCQIDSFSSTRGLYNDAGNYGSRAYVSTDSIAKDKIKVEKNALIYGDIFCGPGGTPNDVFDIKGWVSGSKRILAEAEGTPQIVLPDAADIESNAGDLTIDATIVSWEGWIPADEFDEDTTKAVRYDAVLIDNGAVVNVRGDLRIICTELKIDNKSVINLAPESNLTFFVLGSPRNVEIKDESLVNVAASSADGVDSGIVTLNYLGNRKVLVDKKSHAYMIVVAPTGELEVNDSSHVYGSYLGENLKLDKNAGFHVDISNGDSSNYNPAILVRDKIEFDDKVNVDHFDSLLGAYDGPAAGGTNWGTSALIQTNSIKNDKVKVKGNSTVAANVIVGVGGNPSTVIDVDSGSSLTGTQNALVTPLPIPAVTPPIMTVPYSNDVEYKNTTAVLSTDLHCKKLKMQKAVLTISGDIVIRCDDKIEMEESEIQLAAGSTLTIYVKKEMKIENKSKVNTVLGDPKLVSIRRMSLGKKGKIEIKDESEVHAWIQGAKTELKLEKSTLYGNFMGEKATIKKDAQLHVDMAYLITCVDVDDTDGTRGVAAAGGVTDSNSFSEWFRDVAGVNQSAVHTITMTTNGLGDYEYLDDDFRPIDGKLLGNEGDTNNNHFSYTIVADFVYSECAGQYIKFQGGDGTWMFVDGQIVLDLGGMKSEEKQFVEFDRMGLSDGQTYRIHIFYANRRADSKKFKMQTNLVMSTANAIPVVSAAYD